jgi:hypothetical protein
LKNIQPQAPETKIEKVLLRPIKKCDQEKLQCALKGPTYQPTIQHVELLPQLDTMHDAAERHLARLEDKCAKIPNRLTHFQGSPAAICVENMADKVVNLINECHNTALQKCATKTSTTGNTHYKPSKLNKLRKFLCNKLKHLRFLMKQGQHFQTTIDLDEAMNARRQNGNVYQALTQVYTLLSQPRHQLSPDRREDTGTTK